MKTKQKCPFRGWTAQLFLGTGEESSVWDLAKYPILFGVDQSLEMHGSKHFLSYNSPICMYMKGNLIHLFLIYLHCTHKKSCWCILCLAKFSMGFQEIPIYCWAPFGFPELLGFVFTGHPGGVENTLHWSHFKPAKLCSSHGVSVAARRYPLRSQISPHSYKTLRDGQEEGESALETIWPEDWMKRVFI